MVWFLLVIVGLEEIIVVVVMKYIDGIRKKWLIIVMIVGFGLFFYCFL